MEINVFIPNYKSCLAHTIQNANNKLLELRAGQFLISW